MKAAQMHTGTHGLRLLHMYVILKAPAIRQHYTPYMKQLKETQTMY